jgi:hypothetical protein
MTNELIEMYKKEMMLDIKNNKKNNENGYVCGCPSLDRLPH